jgi:hypothetical protein
MGVIYCFLLFMRKPHIGAVAKQLQSDYFNMPFLLYAARVIFALNITVIAYFNLKQIIPFVNPRLFDQQLWQIDTIIHGNISPTLMALRIPHDWGVWPFMDKFYKTFFLLHFIFFWIFIGQKNSQDLKNKFFTAICLLWIVGGISYFVFPAMGPCYFKPELFKGLNLPWAQKIQYLLLDSYTHATKDSFAYQTTAFSGIAAMPSLHVAFPFLFTLLSWKINRIISITTGVYTLIILIGSVMLGWHYLIDGYAGILEAYLIYSLTLHFVQKPSRRPDQR